MLLLYKFQIVDEDVIYYCIFQIKDLQKNYFQTQISIRCSLQNNKNLFFQH